MREPGAVRPSLSAARVWRPADNPVRTFHRKNITVLSVLLALCMAGLAGRLGYLMLCRSEHYSRMADELHARERPVRAARGRILDAKGKVLAANRPVCTVSVIHSQITEPERVIAELSARLELPEDEVRRKVEKRSAREILRTNVEKAAGDAVRALHLAGVKVDGDYRRFYPYGSLASKVLGFTGGDNQGVIGLEVRYDRILKGADGRILTAADARGVELKNAAEERLEPVPGSDLQISLDVNIQKYAQQAALVTMERKGAKSVSVIVMNPKNGELLAMVNVPEFDPNHPFELNTELPAGASQKEKQELCNRMWRNPAVSDTYEPGSTFKIVTAAAGLEEGVVSLDDRFSCPGYCIVEDRKIRCHKTGGHGSETFLEGAMNSCNPVFIAVGQRLGTENYYKYFERFGLMQKTGVDLPGEAGTIMHRKEDMGPVELATVSFGQSFQITPLQLLTAAACAVNGGTRVTPHFGVKSVSADGTAVRTFSWPVKRGIVSEETGAKMRYLLEQVVANGSGKRAQTAGFRVGGKTATSEKLPRSLKKYISSFVGFAPADDPQVIALITIDEPQGVYYGGTVAAPVIAQLFENILPYLGVLREK